MGVRFLVAAFLICSPGIARAQVSGKFYLEKSVYALGEPIFVYFQATNNGTKAETIYSADPNSDCSAFHASVSNDRPGPSCSRGISCPSSSIVLQPGQNHVERILLNLAHKLDSPGEYSVKVQVARNLVYGSKILAASSTLYFRIDQNAVEAGVLHPWFDQLQSTDPLKRIEAARALASVAPPSSEGTILMFADDLELWRSALHRLNPPRSMADTAAMAELLKKTDPDTFEHWQAAEYLARNQCGR
jgi:hypothetical protein